MPLWKVLFLLIFKKIDLLQPNILNYNIHIYNIVVVIENGLSHVFYRPKSTAHSRGQADQENTCGKQRRHEKEGARNAGTKGK
ncbi:hypothetical protein HOE425_340160 [Hoeflea sp. EC-HK425]|nr:hypothetical protein HOE425_340160 [Hoeflea sp. EC-HK425]